MFVILHGNAISANPSVKQGCTLKEAAIIASVLAKVKVPVLHASAALLQIAEMDYTGRLYLCLFLFYMNVFFRA
jgi:hypothetical protein